MTNLIHSPAGALAPPAEVTEQAAKLKAQGFTIDAIRHGQCQEPEAKGRSGWCITLHDHRKIWFCWVFDVDVMADVQAIAVDVEICWPFGFYGLCEDRMTMARQGVEPRTFRL